MAVESLENGSARRSPRLNLQRMTRRSLAGHTTAPTADGSATSSRASASMLAGRTGSAQWHRRRQLDQQHEKDGKGTWDRRRRRLGPVEPGDLDPEWLSYGGEPDRPHCRRRDHRFRPLEDRRWSHWRLEAHSLIRHGHPWSLRDALQSLSASEASRQISSGSSHPFTQVI